MKRITYYIDILLCVVILPALIMLLPIDRWLEDRTLFAVLFIGWLYATYFMFRGLIIPNLFKGRSQRYFALFVVSVTLVITYLFAQVEGSPRPQYMIERFGIESAKVRERVAKEMGYNIPRRPRNLQMQKQAIWFFYITVSAFAVSVSLLTQLFRHRAINQEIVYEKKRAELALYKAQINPHFLFNTLNTLYGLVVSKSERAEEAFILFTNLMKYIYSNGTADSVSVRDEVEYIGEYVELQTLRLSKLTTVDFQCSESARNSSMCVAPIC